MLKSTEIVIEQLIIGLLTLVIVDLFVWGTPLPQLELGDNAYQSFFYGVLIVIVAYAAGIVVDRWSDTMLEQMERRIRIKVYLSGKTLNQTYVTERESLPNEPSIRIEIWKNDNRVADYHDYMRRRMRITRALTCLMPALFLALALLEYQCQSQEVMRRYAGGFVFAFYASLLIINIIFYETPSKKFKILSKFFKIPKTHPIDELIKYIEGINEGIKKYTLLNQKPDSFFLDEFRFRYYYDPGIIGLILFALVGTLFLIFLHFMVGLPSMSRVLFFIGGLLLTYMIGWAWWRISKTFFTFISSYEQFGRGK